MEIKISLLNELFSYPKSDKKTTYKNRDEVENKLREIANHFFEDRFSPYEDNMNFIPERDLCEVLFPMEGHGLDGFISLLSSANFFKAIENEFGFEEDTIMYDDEIEYGPSYFDELVDYVWNLFVIKQQQTKRKRLWGWGK